MQPDPHLASNRRWRRAVPLLLLLFGLVSGFTLGRMGPGRGPGEHRETSSARSSERSGERYGERSGERLLSRLVTELGLSEEQSARLGVILESNHAEANTFREESWDRYRELRRRFRDEIREILDGAQREQFDAMIRDADRRHRGRNGSASRSWGWGP